MILILLAILDHFQWENDHNSFYQSWITIKNSTFNISKKIKVLPICLPKQISGIISDVQLQKKKSFLVLTSGKFLEALWNWHRLSFLPFIFIFAQCEYIQANVGGLVHITKQPTIGHNLQQVPNVGDCRWFSTTPLHLAILNTQQQITALDFARLRSQSSGLTPVAINFAHDCKYEILV